MPEPPLSLLKSCYAPTIGLSVQTAFDAVFFASVANFLRSRELISMRMISRPRSIRSGRAWSLKRCDRGVED
ncbi:hypothetical protein J6590_035782 [Homalodisca vitripennis]|nr:hypothetical protein J6590_035782 [Homalodisca vitripennis]